MSHPNWDAVSKHIEWLTGSSRSPVAWQVFDDSKRNHDLAKRYYGACSSVATILEDAQQAGCGVYIAVNETDGKARRKENIKLCRAAFLDFDGAPLPHEWPVRPGLIVCSSPGKYQVWWKLERGADLEAWTAVHLDLIARYGADRNCALTTQVGRCAGFMHLKGEPHEVTIIDGPHDVKPMTIYEFAEAFGINVRESLVRHQARLKPASGEVEEPPCGWDQEADVERARAWLADDANWNETSDGAVSVYDAALRMADRERYGGSGSLDEPFPEKPKGMHWRTYRRLAEQDERLTAIWDRGISRRFGIF